MSSEVFVKEVLNSDIPVVVDFWAPWCGPCQAISPFLEELAKLYSGQVKVVKVNVDDSPEVAEEYGIRSIPTFITFKDGKVVRTLSGASKDKLVALIEQVL